MASRFRSTYALLAVLVVLGLVFYFFTSEGASRQRRDSSEGSPYFTESQIDSVTRVVMYRPGSYMTLEQQEGGDWLIKGEQTYKAADEQRENLFRALRQLPVGKLLSQNAENWSKYGLGDENKRGVELFAGEEKIARIYFGDFGPIYSQVYIRHEGNNSVYLTPTLLVNVAGTTVFESWRDKALLPFQSDQIKSLSIRVDEQRWTFDSTDSRWKQVLDGQEVVIEDQESFQKYLDSLFQLSGQGIEKDLKKFSTAHSAVALQPMEGEEYVISLSTSDDKHYARVSGGEDLFTLSTDLKNVLSPNFLQKSDEEAEPTEEKKGDESEAE
ncbi:MAG: DUF4340 domain-containing protein [bacterium]|nr:DUF4340 domain-containing protein [bacterium]